MKLYKFIFVALVSFSLATPAQAWVPGIPSTPTDIEGLKKSAETFVQSTIDSGSETLKKKSEELQQYSKGKWSEILNQWKKRVEDLTGIHSQSPAEPTETRTAINPTPTPAPINTPIGYDSTPNSPQASSDTSIVTEATDIVTIGKRTQKPVASVTTSVTTRLLDALGDPWVRIAVVAGVVIYARYKYKQSQKQLEEFKAAEEEKK